MKNLLETQYAFAGVLETDCSASLGASGSPLLVDGDEVIGILSATSHLDCPAFAVGRCSTLALAFSDELRTAIEKLKNGSTDPSIVVIQRQGFRKKTFPTPKEIYDAVRGQYLRRAPNSLTPAQATVIWQIGRMRFESEKCGEKLTSKVIVDRTQADFEQQLSVSHEAMAHEAAIVTSDLVKGFAGALPDEIRVMCQNASYARFEIHEFSGRPRIGSAVFPVSKPLLGQDTLQIIEKVEKERHLAMIETDINSFDARSLSLLGSLIFENRVCGDAVVSEDDIEEVWNVVKSPNINDQIRKAQTDAYANALSAALAKVIGVEKEKICRKARSEIANLKRKWGLN